LREAKAELEAGLGRARGDVAHLEARYASLADRHRGELADVRADAESSTKAVLKSAMGTLQSLAEEQQLLLDGLLQKYGDDSEMLADLMSVDHTGSQIGRRAKGISVLCGGW
ncbi:ATP-binding protein, partial [Streptomyces sp. SID11233]|nr:ATP-binding protein [Streptomyces sp. SID11233]